jgi:hypothetical protein
MVHLRISRSRKKSITMPLPDPFVDGLSPPQSPPLRLSQDKPLPDTPDSHPTEKLSHLAHTLHDVVNHPYHRLNVWKKSGNKLQKRRSINPDGQPVATQDRQSCAPDAQLKGNAALYASQRTNNLTAETPRSTSCPVQPQPGPSASPLPPGPPSMQLSPFSFEGYSNDSGFTAACTPAFVPDCGPLPPAPPSLHLSPFSFEGRSGSSSFAGTCTAQLSLDVNLQASVSLCRALKDLGPRTVDSPRPNNAWTAVYLEAEGSSMQPGSSDANSMRAEPLQPLHQPPCAPSAGSAYSDDVPLHLSFFESSSSLSSAEGLSSWLSMSSSASLNTYAMTAASSTILGEVDQYSLLSENDTPRPPATSILVELVASLVHEDRLDAISKEPSTSTDDDGASSNVVGLGISAFLRTSNLDTALDTNSLMSHLTSVPSLSVTDIVFQYLCLSPVPISPPMMSPTLTQIIEVSSCDDTAAYEEHSFDLGKILALFPAPPAYPSWDQCMMTHVELESNQVPQAYVVVTC